MPEAWFFQKSENWIDMTCRAEGGGAVGDAHSRLTPGREIVHPKGLTYAALAAHAGGVLEIAEDGSFKIIPAS